MGVERSNCSGTVVVTRVYKYYLYTLVVITALPAAGWRHRRLTLFCARDVQFVSVLVHHVDVDSQHLICL